MNVIEVRAFLFKPLLKEMFALYVKNSIDPQQFGQMFERIRQEAFAVGITQPEFLDPWLPELHEFFRELSKTDVKKQKENRKKK